MLLNITTPHASISYLFMFRFFACAETDHMYYYVAVSSVLVQTATGHYYIGCMSGFLTPSLSFMCQRRSSRS